MLADLLKGARYLWRGFGMIRQPGLRRFFVLPVLINFIFFSILIYFGFGWFDLLVNWLLPDSENWWAEIARIVLYMVFGVTVLIIMFLAFSVVINLIGAPFNGLLAEQVEARLRGKPQTGERSMTAIILEMGAAVLGELRKYSYFGVIALILLVVTFIPVLNFVMPVVWAIFGSWMMVLEYLAYPMENHGHAFPAVRSAARQQRWLALGFGAAVVLAVMVPLVNFLVMPAAVAGATAMWVENFAEQQSN